MVNKTKMVILNNRGPRQQLKLTRILIPLSKIKRWEIAFSYIVGKVEKRHKSNLRLWLCQHYLVYPHVVVVTLHFWSPTRADPVRPLQAINPLGRCLLLGSIMRTLLKKKKIDGRMREIRRWKAVQSSSWFFRSRSCSGTAKYKKSLHLSLPSNSTAINESHARFTDHSWMGGVKKTAILKVRGNCACRPSFMLRNKSGCNMKKRVWKGGVN